jgi:D-alanyl-D-alanine dipeptidase
MKSTKIKGNKVWVEQGFEPFLFEWWHFDYKGWQEQPVLDIEP